MNEIPDGLHEKMPDHVYHEREEVSNSDLKLLNDYPAKLLAKKRGQLPESSDALNFGRQFHAAVLEPDKFADKFICKPQGMSFASKEGKAWREGQTKEIISFDDYQAIVAMAASAHAHPSAGPYIRAKGRRELSAFSTHERTCLNLRCRFDLLTDENVIVDLKSIRSARPFDVVRDCAYNRYFVQDAFYMDMLHRLKHPCEGFVFIAIEKTAPYPVLAFELDARSVEKGRSEYERLLDVYLKCQTEGKWPGYSETTELLTLPEWALKERPFESAIAYTLLQ